MPTSGNEGVPGKWLHADAVDKRTRAQFSQMLDSVLKVAADYSIIGNITINNPLPPSMGLIGKFVIWSNLTAMKKPEGAETGEQKVNLEEGVTYQLEQWEERIAITDEAKITMVDQHLLQL